MTSSDGAGVAGAAAAAIVIVAAAGWFGSRVIDVPADERGIETGPGTVAPPLGRPGGPPSGPPSGPPGGAGGSRGGEIGPYRVVGKVVFGEARRAPGLDRVGVVDIGRCFDAIPEYAKVRNLPNTRARYYFFLRDANDKFAKGVRRVASERGIALVVEKGGVVGGDRAGVVDLTAPVVEVLSEE